MTKTAILAVLLKHSKFGNGYYHFMKKDLDGSVDEIYTEFQKALGKEARKKSTEYADPAGYYHDSNDMNDLIREYIKMRRRIRKPITKNAIDLLLKRFREGGFTRAECKDALMVACSSETMGVFPKKKFRKPEHANPDPKTIDYTEGLPTHRKPATT
jgi:hypothetical protein